MVGRIWKIDFSTLKEKFNVGVERNGHSIWKIRLMSFIYTKSVYQSLKKTLNNEKFFWLDTTIVYKETNNILYLNYESYGSIALKTRIKILTIILIQRNEALYTNYQQYAFEK